MGFAVVKTYSVVYILTQLSLNMTCSGFMEVFTALNLTMLNLSLSDCLLAIKKRALLLAVFTIGLVVHHGYSYCDGYIVFKK